jgi:hypothetical protein
VKNKERAALICGHSGEHFLGFRQHLSKVGDGRLRHSQEMVTDLIKKPFQPARSRSICLLRGRGTNKPSTTVRPFSNAAARPPEAASRAGLISAFLAIASLLNGASRDRSAGAFRTMSTRPARLTSARPLPGTLCSPRRSCLHYLMLSLPHEV